MAGKERLVKEASKFEAMNWCNLPQNKCTQWAAYIKMGLVAVLGLTQNLVIFKLHFLIYKLLLIGHMCKLSQYHEKNNWYNWNAALSLLTSGFSNTLTRQQFAKTGVSNCILMVTCEYCTLASLTIQTCK